MTESDTSQITEVIEHCGYQIGLTQAGLDWIAAVASPGQRPTLIMAPDRATAINKARNWVDLQRVPDKTSE